MGRRPPSAAGTVALLGAVAALGLDGALSIGLVSLLVTFWMWKGTGGRERWMVGMLLAVAVGFLSHDFWLRERTFDPVDKELAITGQFRSLWSELDAAAAQAASALEAAVEPERLFEVLAGESRAARNSDLTYLLMNGDGTTTAWAGNGLLHDLEEASLPAQGRSFRLGFQSATLFSVVARPGSAGEKVVVGRSLFKSDLPTRDRFLGPIRWTVFRAGDVVPARLVTLDIGAGPRIAVEDWRGRSQPSDRWISRSRRWGAIALGLALLVSGLIRGGLALPWLVAGAAFATALGAKLDLPTALSLAAATAVSLWAWQSFSQRRTPVGVAPPLHGLIGAAGVVAIAHLAIAGRGLLDLGSSFSPGHEGTAWRLILAGLSIAWLVSVRSNKADQGGDGEGAVVWGWLGVLSVLVASAFHDWGLVPVYLLLAVAAVSTALWASSRLRPISLASGILVCVMGSLLGAATWETSYRQALKEHLRSEILPGLEQPSAADLELLGQKLERYFSELDLDQLVLPNPAGMDPQDLGIAVWSGSPLAVSGALSAVTTRPFESAHSSFSFGLPLTNEGFVDWTPTRWRKVEEPSPEGSIISGTTNFLHGGRPWAEVSYTLLMRPGFGLASTPIENLSTGLLSEGPGPFRPDPELIAPAAYGLYSESGSAMEAAWPGVDLPLDRLLEEPGALVRAPGRLAFGFAKRSSLGIQVLLLPVLGSAEALERVGTHAVAVLAALAALAALAWLAAQRVLPQSGLFDAVLRSYSKRMLLVTSLLLLIPVVLLNTFALRVLGEYLRKEQKAGGEAALQSSQRVLGEYIETLEPGFVVQSMIDDELLSWLSRVVHHEINLYWGSSLYASSKSELFSAGLLPKRIPGEIYSDLALRQARSAERVNHAGHNEYLELYAPLSVPGSGTGPSGLFLSVPLIAQQAETQAELSSLRRKILLATAGLVLLLLAVGNRLARGFTVPLMDIVRGTQRIAAGARSIDVDPSDRELATLVQAIDRMAQRIDEGRQRLMREKTLVDRMIDNVNSGVVSLDRNGRVLLCNQVARDLLHAEVGELLVDSLGEELAPVAEFLAATSGDRCNGTVKLPAESGDPIEWSLVWVPLEGEGQPTALFVVEDISEVLRGQRLQAWAEMARIIAHEIKNPLTPIRLSAEHMREVYAERRDEFDNVFERCTHNILTQVDELQEISSDFSVYSRLPKIEPVAGDLGEVVRQVTAGYTAADPEKVVVRVDPELAGVVTRFDAKLIRRALRNLLENALRASRNGAGIEVRVVLSDLRASIQVLDNGPGVAPELLARIFDPYFSTHDSGTGLGLPITRRIAEEHGGGVLARNRAEGGLSVELWIPVSA